VARSAVAPRTAPRPEHRPRVARPQAPVRRASQAPSALRVRVARMFFVFVVCLAVLGVGRVALSFAVVQKSLQTDRVQTEYRALQAENADLQAEVTRLSSSSRIRSIAQSQLGLVPAGRPVYLEVATAPSTAPGDPGH